MNTYIVITTINNKSDAVSLFEGLNECKLILVGDVKSPVIDSGTNLNYISIEAQKRLGYSYVDKCPVNHYARKNIGYLYAIHSGADVIYDTDDDNYPLNNWYIPDFKSEKVLICEDLFVNVYNYFTDSNIWPRGIPLSSIRGASSSIARSSSASRIGVWQGLANGDPDVDAVYRLTSNKQVIFDDKDEVHIPAHHYCPFNSQNTFWDKESFPLLYLPATTSFRFTDILRGYVAQRILWVSGAHLGFFKATVHQYRNEHDYMKDFRDEIEMYLQVERIVDLLEKIELDGDIIENLRSVYSLLSDEGIVMPHELELLDLWLEDYMAKLDL